MKLTKKQEEIKSEILAGTDVLFADVDICKVIDCLNDIKSGQWRGAASFYGVDEEGNFTFLAQNEIKDRPIINMSEWFEESEDSTKDMREYDEKLLTDYNVYLIENDLEEDLLRAKIKFVNKRYQNEALL